MRAQRINWTCAHSENKDQPAHQRSLITVFVVRLKKSHHQSLRWPPQETLVHCLATERPTKWLIRLCGCACWSESSLDAYVRRYNFSHCSFWSCFYDVSGHRFDNEQIKEFLQRTHDLIVEEALDKGTSRETKVVNFEHPEDLKVRQQNLNVQFQLLDFQSH